jgi:hypothetical protein
MSDNPRVDLLENYLGKGASGKAPIVLGPCFEVALVPPGHIEFRKRDQTRVSYQYHMLGVAKLDASKGVVLKFGGLEVTLHGRRLEPAFKPLSDKLVACCIEGDERDGEDRSMPFITRIEFK